MPIQRKIELLKALENNAEMLQLAQQILKSMQELRAKQAYWDAKIHSQHMSDIMEVAIQLITVNNWTLPQSLDFMEYQLLPSQMKNIDNEKQLLERNLRQLVDQELDDLEEWLALPQEDPSEMEYWPCTTLPGEKLAASASPTAEDPQDQDQEEEEEEEEIEDEDSPAENSIGKNRKGGNGDDDNGDNQGNGDNRHGGKELESGKGGHYRDDGNNSAENGQWADDMGDQGSFEQPMEHSLTEINLHAIFYSSTVPSSLGIVMDSYVDATHILMGLNLSFPGSPTPYHDYTA